MSLHSGKVSEDKAQIVAETLPDLLDDWKDLSAVDALKVPILEESYGCGFWA